MAKLIEVKLAWNREYRSIWINPDIIAGIDDINGRYTLYTSQPIGSDSYSQKHPITREEWYRLKNILLEVEETEEEAKEDEVVPVPVNTNCRCWNAPQPHHALLNNMAHHLSELSEDDRNEVIDMARSRTIDSDPAKRLALEVSKLNGYGLGAFMQYLMEFGEANQKKIYSSPDGEE